LERKGPSRQQHRFAADAAPREASASAVRRDGGVSGDDAYFVERDSHSTSGNLGEYRLVPWPCSVTLHITVSIPVGSRRSVAPSCAEMRAPPTP